MYSTNFKLLLFLINAQAYLSFHEKYEEHLLLFFLHYFTVLLFLFNSLKIFRVWHGDSRFKKDVLGIMFFVWKVTMQILTSLQPWRYISLLKLENTTTRMRLKNRMNILLRSVGDCYTHFSDYYLLISMTIQTFRCLYNILQDLEAFCAFDLLQMHICIHLLAAIFNLSFI